MIALALPAQFDPTEPNAGGMIPEKSAEPAGQNSFAAELLAMLEAGEMHEAPVSTVAGPRAMPETAAQEPNAPDIAAIDIQRAHYPRDEVAQVTTDSETAPIGNLETFDGHSSDLVAPPRVPEDTEAMTEPAVQTGPMHAMSQDTEPATTAQIPDDTEPEAADSDAPLAQPAEPAEGRNIPATEAHEIPVQTSASVAPQGLVPGAAPPPLREAASAPEPKGTPTPSPITAASAINADSARKSGMDLPAPSVPRTAARDAAAQGAPGKDLPPARAVVAPIAPNEAIAASALIPTTPSGSPVSAPGAPAPLLMSRPDWPVQASAAITSLAPDGGTMTLELTPDDLGRVVITVTVDKDSATVRFQTETPEAARMFNDAERQLSSELARGGLTLANHEASSDRRAPGAHAHTQGRAGTNSGENGDPDNAPHIPARHLQGLVNLIA